MPGLAFFYNLMINKAAKTAFKALALTPRKSWFSPGLARLFRTETAGSAEKRDASDKTGKKLNESSHEYAMRVLSSFKENLDREQGKENLRFDIVRLRDLLLIIDPKTAEELRRYAKSPAYTAFVNLVRDNFEYFDLPGNL